MDIADAFQIVIDLAKQNMLDDTCDLELMPERKRQQEAINMLEDLIVND